MPPPPGYPGGTAVAGNHAAKQFQLDVFGEALSLFAEAAYKDTSSPRRLEGGG